MKQQGRFWIDAEGIQTDYSRVSDYERVCERIGQRISAIAVTTEEKLLAQRSEISRLCAEVLSRYQALNKKEDVKRFSFTTFDKAFKFEIDVKEQYFRVYRATKPNPGYKDYALVCMDFSQTANRILLSEALNEVKDIEEEKLTTHEPEKSFKFEDRGKQGISDHLPAGPKPTPLPGDQSDGGGGGQLHTRED